MTIAASALIPPEPRSSLADALSEPERRVLVAWLLEVAHDLGAGVAVPRLPGVPWSDALPQAARELGLEGDLDEGEPERLLDRAREIVISYRDPGAPEVGWADVLREARDLAAWGAAFAACLPPLWRERVRVLQLAYRLEPQTVETIAANAVRHANGLQVRRWTESADGAMKAPRGMLDRDCLPRRNGDSLVARLTDGR